MGSFSVADQFAVDLGGRYEDDGPNSGEEFRETKLLTLADHALKSRTPIRINFDGVASMPPSFLEEAFGGLARRRPQASETDLARFILIEAPNSPHFWPYVKHAQDAMAKAARRAR